MKCFFFVVVFFVIILGMWEVFVCVKVWLFIVLLLFFMVGEYLMVVFCDGMFVEVVWVIMKCLLFGYIFGIVFGFLLGLLMV